ncbi:HAD-IA family hydrolase [Terriglobus sp. 2YAB30_2]|uniref:HAD-IA family hydrolase n=1 Tax=Terriglobus sp. 2YAB30_2 TaxID=3233023 RepID=UPI003F999C3E
MAEHITVFAKGLLFDNDGVLISSIGSVNRCWRQWAKMYGVPDAENYNVPHGARAIDTVKSLRPDIDPEAGLRVIEDLEMADTDDIEVLPGVRRLLTTLPPERWAIVTSCTSRLLEVRLEAAGLPWPEKLVAGDMVTNGKPHPEPYQRGAALLGVAPEECIVIEDAPAGVGAGKAAGARVLAVLGTHTEEELAQADWIVPSLDEVQFTASEDGLTLTFPSVK